MPMTRIARTHLVYQFIILTLVFLGICYYELLLERRFVMFLLIVPMFFYQLVILSCCTDLISMPGWINLSDSQDGRGENATANAIESSQSTEENCKIKTGKPTLPAEPNNLSNIYCDQKVSTRKYKFKNCKAFSSSPGNSLLKSPSVASIMTNDLTTSKKPKDFSFSFNNSDQIQSSELTKRYFFPYRQKRLEQWIESKENSRPYKIRNWQSHINDPEPESMSASNSTEVTSTKNSPDQSFPECSSVPECSVIPESEMTKRYTFPFRQKRDLDLMESDGDSNILPSTPYWHTVGYSVAVKQEARRRRRSVSSSLLTTRQIGAGKFESERSKDFSQSVEISRVPNDSITENAQKTSSPIATTFGKMKIGIVNCFSKIKRDNSKANYDKEHNCKRRTFKSIFQSRENINSEHLGKENRSNSEARIESPCGFYPPYIPYQSDRFESDVRKRMFELPKER